MKNKNNKIQTYRMEKWSEDRLVSTFEEKTNMNWEEWKYRKAIKQCGGFRGELMIKKK